MEFETIHRNVNGSFNVGTLIYITFQSFLRIIVLNINYIIC